MKSSISRILRNRAYLLFVKGYDERQLFPNIPVPSPSAYPLFEKPPAPGTLAAVAVWKVTPPDRDAMLLFIPLAVVPEEVAAEEHVIAVLPPDEADHSRRLVEAFSVDDFVRAFETILGSSNAAFARGALRVGQTPALRNAGLLPGSAFAIRRSSAEQSNTSIRIGDRPERRQPANAIMWSASRVVSLTPVQRLHG
jgi:hypothetical protein